MDTICEEEEPSQRYNAEPWAGSSRYARFGHAVQFNWVHRVAKLANECDPGGNINAAAYLSYIRYCCMSIRTPRAVDVKRAANLPSYSDDDDALHMAAFVVDKEVRGLPVLFVIGLHFSKVAAAGERFIPAMTPCNAGYFSDEYKQGFGEQNLASAYRRI